MSDDDDFTEQLGNLAGFLAAAALIIFQYGVHGWVFMKLWQWFVVPLGAPPIGIWWAIGVGITVSFLTNHSKHYKNHKIDARAVILETVFQPVMAFVIGWIVHGQMTP